MSVISGQATITEVAKEAGVSTATAARALGNYGLVKPSTREKIMKAADKLSYRPNELARSMITGKTMSIGVVCGDVYNPFFAGILRGITDVATERGYTVLIANSDEDWSKEIAAVGTLGASGVDGIIVSPAEPNRVDHLINWSGKNKPVTLIDRASATFRTDAVVVDGPQAVHDVLLRLFKLGHERIAIVGEFRSAEELERVLSLNERGLEKLDVFTLSPSAARLVGYLRAHAQTGKQVDASLIIRAGSYSIDSAESATREVLLKSRSRPTALVTTDNVMSLGAYRAVLAAGLRIPEQFSFVGFDNQDWTELVTPPISVIDQPSHSMGRAAANVLIERIKGNQDELQILTAHTSYIERASVAPVPTKLTPL